MKQAGLQLGLIIIYSEGVCVSAGINLAGWYVLKTWWRSEMSPNCIKSSPTLTENLSRRINAKASSWFNEGMITFLQGQIMARAACASHRLQKSMDSHAGSV